MATRTSAGILLFRRTAGGAEGGIAIEILMAHPGGPFFARRDQGHWTIPKGELDDDIESLEDVARREFREETGHDVPADTPLVDLGSIVQKGGKTVFAWAVEGDMDPATAASLPFEIEWPPGSGRTQSFPEIDRVAWFDPAEARRRVKSTQIPFIDRLEAALADESPDVSRGDRS